MKVLGDMYDDSWKKKSFSFVLKFWSTEKQKYHNFDFTFNEAERMMFLNSHGQFNCPPAKNDELGNWLAIQYWWPPKNLEEKDRMRIVVSRKPLITRTNKTIPNDIHNLNCDYVQHDRNNNFDFFLSFFFEDIK